MRDQRGGGSTALESEPLPGGILHGKSASVGRFRNPFHQERACYP